MVNGELVKDLAARQPLQSERRKRKYSTRALRSGLEIQCLRPAGSTIKRRFSDVRMSDGWALRNELAQPVPTYAGKHPARIINSSSRSEIPKSSRARVRCGLYAGSLWIQLAHRFSITALSCCHC